MAGKELLVDLSKLDLSQIVADIEEIRRYNPQRHEMEQLTAIVYANLDDFTCVGYKEVTEREFWVRGHMPSMPLMPGVVMLEIAAQTCSFFALKYDLVGAKVVGFGGLEDVRFRGPVVPGDALYMICRLTKVRRGRMIVSDFQGVARGNVVVEGVIRGVPLPVDALGGQQ